MNISLQNINRSKNFGKFVLIALYRGSGINNNELYYSRNLGLIRKIIQQKQSCPAQHTRPTAYSDHGHRGMNTRGENWLLWKGPTVCRLICVLCHNFWTNYYLDLFSTSKWLSELQFCDRYLCRWQKID